MLVSTNYGQIRGHKKDNMIEFLGIPYAKPPVGDLRWREPERPDPWDGILEASDFGKPACQALSQVIPGGDPADRGDPDRDGKEVNGSEDCLYMNIWRPEVPSEEKMAIYIWIHGGAYCCGSGAGMNAAAQPFCDRGIIYVTFNYRLGLMGFFAHPELTAESPHHASGNYAHLDQLAAVRWVKENIAAFGGDPDRITVGGCSAGAGGTQVLMCSPLAKGLFRNAIVQSSIGCNIARYDEPFLATKLADFEKRGLEFQEKVGCKSLAELRKLSYEELIAFDECHFRRKFHYGTTLGTMEDGYLLPKFYRDAMDCFENADIPMIVGNTHDEGGEHVHKFSPDVFEAQARFLFGDTAEEYLSKCKYGTIEEAIESYRMTHIQYAGAKAFAAVNAKLGRQPVYVFDFKRANPKFGIAPHGWDTRFLLNVYKRFGMTDADDVLADAMHDYWCNFVKYNDPNGPTVPYWPAYTENTRDVLCFDTPCTAENDSTEENELMKMTRIMLEKKLERNYNERKTSD